MPRVLWSDSKGRNCKVDMYFEKLHYPQSSRHGVLKILSKLMAMKDCKTLEHAKRVQQLVNRLVIPLGFNGRRAVKMSLFARFHDVGKVGIPDSVLLKQGHFTDEECSIMREHCEIGYQIAHSTFERADIADWVLKHHEHWDGRGYPLGLKKEKIPLECRILAIADAYDSMTSDRPYRKAMRHKDAIIELKRCPASQFDPFLLERCIEVLSENEIAQ